MLVKFQSTKKEKTTDLSKFRPISLLPIISKVIETAVLEQTNTFLLENNIWYNFQPGFRLSHSPNPCLPYLIDKVLK